MSIVKSTLTHLCTDVVFFINFIHFISILPASAIIHVLLEMSSPGCYMNGWDRVSFLSKL